MALGGACHSEHHSETTSAAAGKTLLVRNARLPGGSAVEVFVVDGIIVEVENKLDRKADETIDAKARYLVPGIIDSHVHLDYLPVADELVKKGIAGAVDLAAPLPLRPSPAGLELVTAGPMLAAKGGYPTRSWGQDGYGIEHQSGAEIRSTINKLSEAGARLIKFSLGAGPDLSDDLLRQAIDHAHSLGMKVAVHALGDAEAANAAELGADILAHTPLEPLQASTIELWSSKAVISTLTAFGNAQSTAENLRALHDAGATVLYGTDLGNTRDIGISCPEIRAMQEAGLADAEILHSMTKAPAEYFTFSSLGAIELGNRARLLLVDEDPLQSVQTLCKVSLVVSDS